MKLIRFSCLLITNTHIDIYLIKPTTPNYHVKFSNTWKITSKNNTHTTKTITPMPLPTIYHHQSPLKYHPQQCIYTDGSFIPPSKNSERQIEGNTAGSGIYSPNKDIKKSERLPGYQNIIRVELNAILIIIKTIQTTQTDTHIFTYSLNSIYLINNHIQHPTSQHHHPDKLLIAAIIHQIY